MMGTHVINRQVIELKLASEKNAYRVQQRVRELYQSEVLPLLDELMSGLTHEDEILCIDRLELDLGVLSFEKFDQEVLQVLRSHVEEQLKKQIRQAAENRNEQIAYVNGNSSSVSKTRQSKSAVVNMQDTGKKTPVDYTTVLQNENFSVIADEYDGKPEQNALFKERDQSALELLQLFFETGLLPWWSADEFDAPNIDELISDLVYKKPVSLVQLFVKLAQSPFSARRLVQQTQRKTRIRLMAVLPATRIQLIRKSWMEIVKLIKNNTSGWVKPETEALIFITALLAEGLPENETERVPQELMRAAAFISNMPLAEVEKLVYTELLVWIIQNESKKAAEHLLVPYFLNWEKKQLANAVSVSGSKVLRLETLLQVEKQDAAVKTIFPELRAFIQKRGKATIHESWKTAIAGFEKEQPALPEKKAKKQVPEELKPGPEFLPVKEEELPELPKTPAAGMTRYAGLVLLSPFLPAFFTALDLLVEYKFRDDAACHKAIHLLHFMATGKTKAPEYELMLHKLLCGLELSAPVPKVFKLSAAEKKEAMLFLDDVTEQWTALRSSSGEVLRNTFMRRHGIIEKKEGAWLLRVERGAVDVMLDTLPWTISIIKAPWMQQLLHTEW